MGKSYPTLAEFYGESKRRLHSPEVDYGKWRGPGKRKTRVSYIRDTGEVYSVVMLLGPWDGGDKVKLLGTVPDADELDRVLEGWEQAVRKRNSAQWVKDRLAAAG